MTWPLGDYTYDQHRDDAHMCHTCPEDNWHECIAGYRDLIDRIWGTYSAEVKRTKDGCSDDLEEFLAELSLVFERQADDEMEES